MRGGPVSMFAGRRVAVLLVLAALSPSTADAQDEAAGRAVVAAPEHTTLVHPPFAHTLGIHRARTVHLKVFLGDRTRFDNPQGVAAVKFAFDDDPDVRADDYRLTLFGVNAGRGEIVYNSSMQTLAIYGRRGAGIDQFESPHGIAATTDGRVYVADTGNRRVARLRWDAVERALGWTGAWDVATPYDVAADARGNVYVTDRDGGVLRFADSTAGAGTAFLPPSPVTGDRWPLPADTRGPLTLAIADGHDPWYQRAVYRLYLVDLDGRRIRAIDPDGSVVAEATADVFGDGDDGARRFYYIALDYYGNVYASDPGRGVVYKLDADLAPLTVFPGTGDPNQQLEQPRGVAIWRRFGQVFVAEREGAQYFFLGTDLYPAAGQLAFRHRRDLHGWETEIFLTERATVSASFVDAAGDTLGVAEFGVVETGARTVRWNADAWSLIPPDDWEERTWRVLIEARPTYSSRRRFSRVRDLEVVWDDP